MDKLLLQRIMLDNQKEVEAQQVIVRNISFEDFDRYILVGIRRAGKSYLLYQQMQKLLKEGHGWDEMLYLNFEDERLEGFSTQDFNLILEAHFELYNKRPMLWMKFRTSLLGINSLADWLIVNTRCLLRVAMLRCLVLIFKLLWVGDSCQSMFILMTFGSFWMFVKFLMIS